MNSPIKWFGGKGSLAGWILKYFPPHDKYNTYVEPFAGGASILFAKPQSKVEVYNDKDRLLVNFFSVLRNDFDEFKRQLDAMPFSRLEFYEAQKVLEDSVMKLPEDPMDAAVKFFVLARQAFSGDIFGGWSVNIKNAATPGWIKAIERLPEVWNRFKHVHVEDLDGLDCIEKYDSYNTLFYLDPPYTHRQRSGTRYRVDVSSTYHQKLIDKLRNISGMAILSGYHNTWYDRDLVDEGDWNFAEYTSVIQAAGKTKKSGLQGNGSMADKTKVEVVWWNPAVDKASKQLDMFSNIG